MAIFAGIFLSFAGPQIFVGITSGQQKAIKSAKKYRASSGPAYAIAHPYITNHSNILMNQ